MAFIDLPNKVPVKNPGNLTAEQTRYETLYKKAKRTVEGQEVFNSPTSGVFYSTADYPDDVDVFNKGEEGMMNLLFKYVLRDSILTASDIQDIRDSVARLRNDMMTRNDIGFENSIFFLIDTDLYLKKQMGYGQIVNRNYYLNCFKDSKGITIVKGTFSDGKICV